MIAHRGHSLYFYLFLYQATVEASATVEAGATVALAANEAHVAQVGHMAGHLAEESLLAPVVARQTL